MQLGNQCYDSTAISREWCCHLANAADLIQQLCFIYNQELWIRIVNRIVAKI